MIRASFHFSFLVVLLTLLAGCQDQPPPGPKVEQQEIFTTLITLSLYNNPDEAVYTSIFDRLHLIDGWMSDYRSDSEISHVTAQAGIAPVKVSPETLHVVKQALVQSALTNGIFDPSIGPVTHLWNVGSDTAHVPTPAAIAAAKALVNWKDVVIDDQAGTIFLKRRGMQLDVGGIAKGFAMDQALTIARKARVTTGIFNMGNSSIGLLGTKPGGKAWKIGVQDPFQASGAYFATVDGSEMTVETSGPYQKFFMAGGKRYHHIMDPRTGSPAASGLEQVTLILPLDTKLADGLSTSCFILGLDRGLALVESLPDAAAVFVTSDRRVVVSSRVGSKFNLIDKTFTLVPSPRRSS